MNTTLTSLDLSWNGLLYDGSVAVSKCLKSCKTLTSLDVSHNNINWNGAYVISKGLAANSTLQVLKVGIAYPGRQYINQFIRISQLNECVEMDL